ncbi:UDP-glucose 4-epimerase GalE [Candidatus Methylopumilus universalis]|uniref:UDP-glucose 4-epimerase n=1 Tax=Candidatus Methylopumilus universalis TaxID=2588536 RepID=A0AAX1EZK9_9PROT|nr:UDP-glucose 4-epimerase GalE [Candidatus Methylopumilus universalis]QDC41244.1 UDP-glucose 4-epimerase GalE [Candidatus Methylopumilus universalis]QDC42534.1 UDP-glucose 4-epimerase GalE [Candidatus Methylopumilus universalis]QDC54920.1 UDP-glucose 4-epimerase GalE [Candidatus Methylopumilus universalis]QDC56201.1 UDP-glucose 4-epimerase GalE [Candidatus Methylopumilus universalis]QDC57483.1 UDP-glucose 4-epimerase GalE [Candidatus Methylopumilus universalis]
MKVLVTGGAGYIGSHMVRMLIEHKNSVVVLDDLSTGFQKSVLGANIVIGSLCDKEFLDSVFAANEFDVVMHFAGASLVSESVINPAKYYSNNLIGTINLLNALNKFEISNLVFSSSASVFGIPNYLPIDERHVQAPINPYGRSKSIIESILNDYSIAYGIRSVSLRYFNAAGASLDGKIGELHDPETHLIPLVLQAAKHDQEFIIFGDDYDTADGTCIRDYIHVLDICDAHLLSANYLISGGETCSYNLGNGNGYSTKQIVKVAEAVVRKKIKINIGPRRHGDPPVLISNSNKIKNDLAWVPKFFNIEDIINHAWAWEINSRF